MVSEKKKQAVEDLKGLLSKYHIIGMLDMYKLPSKQLQDIRDSLRGKATIKMVRKNVIKLAIEGVKIRGMEKLENEIKNQPALLLSELNPFELAKIIASSKSAAPVKAGDIATKDIIVKEGPTNLKPGPVIGELQRVKLPAGVEGDKIVLKKDTVVAKEGDEISKPLADVLMKLGVEPAEIGLNLLCVYDRGTIYGKDILFVPTEKYVGDMINAHRSAFNLALNIGYLAADTLPLLISKAHNEAMLLAMEANVITKENVGSLLSKAQAQMESLKERIGDLGSAEEAAVKEEAEAKPEADEKKKGKGKTKEDKKGSDGSKETKKEVNVDKKSKQEG